MKSLLSKYINTLIFIWITSGFFALLIYFIWILDRGFEITDESYYLLIAMHPSAVKLFNSAQHWFTSIIWIVTGSLYLFRASGLFILLFTTALLTRGILHAYSVLSVVKNPKRNEKAILYACTLSGALLYGTSINFSPCYNLLAAATAYIAIGLVLLTVGRPITYKIIGCYLFVGCVLGVAVLNKFSTGFATMFLLFTLIAVLGNNRHSKISGIAFVFIGMLTTISFFIFYHSMTENVISEFQFGMSVFKMLQPESTITRLLRYVHEFSNQIFWSGALLLLPLAYLSSYTKTINMPRYTNYAIWGIVLLCCFYFRKPFYMNRWVGVSSLLSTLIVVSLIASLYNWTKNFKVFTLTIGLIIMPYCVAVGTGNAINTEIVDSIASWGGVIAILSIANNKSKGGIKGFKMITCALFVSIISIQAAVTSLSPYHLNASYWKQTVPTKIGSIGTVYTDQTTHKFITSLTAIKQNFIISKDRPYLGFYDLYGIPLIIDAIPVFSPWWSLPKQAEFMLSKINPHLWQSSIIGIQMLNDGTMPSLPRQFLNFPTNYTKCGELICPYGNRQIQIWVPNK